MDQQPEATGGVRREVERLCRLCATITTHPNQRVDIFAVDGLRSKIETCLLVHVLKESLLPDTLCTSCNDKICSFFAFRKRAVETLKILEENFHVTESCFKSPQQLKVSTGEKSTTTDNLLAESTQFEAWKCKKLATFHYEEEDFAAKQEHRRKLLNCALVIERAKEVLANTKDTKTDKLVEYDYNSSDNESQETQETQREHLLTTKTSYRNKLYFDDKVNDIINEIQERKSTKRKLEALFGDNPAEGEARNSKIFKPSLNLSELFPDSGSNRRKKRPPAKRGSAHAQPTQSMQHAQITPIIPAINAAQLEQLPQVCLLCDQQFPKGTLLAKHVFDTHGIDMAQVLSSEPIPEGMTRTLHTNLQNLQLQQSLLQSAHAQEICEVNSMVDDRSPASPKTASAEKKKKLPELVKITDLKTKRESIEMKVPDDAPPTLTASYVCPLCPASLTNKNDLYAHLRMRHAQHAKLICGLCLHIGTSLSTLQEHLDSCTKTHTVIGYFVCQVCKYAEDNQKSLENHILVHDFLLADCKKDGKIFDPSDFMETNEISEPKFYNCTECGSSLQSFKEYSSHKRSEHSIFHCDLCNKSYGRNSHLWKHVNRVHKGHPSVTCQFCYKTSASKYHLLQHFNKIHTQKAGAGISLGGGSGGGMTSSLSMSMVTGASKLKNGEVLSEFEEDDFMMKKFDPFDFQSVRQSFMRAELEAKKSGTTQPDLDSSTNKKISIRNPELRDLSSLKMPTVPPKELDSSSTIYTNIITNYTPPTNDGEYKCPKCSKAFHKRTLLKKHKKNCRPRLQKDLLTRCKSCSRIFKDRQSLAKHLVNYHSEYSCEMCDEKVQSKCEIVSHIRFTHPGSHLNCQDCGNVLRNNDLLRAHLQDHANSFVCQFCGDILPSKIKLKMHILSLHRKILSLSCGVCLKLFESQHILRDHVRMVHREALQPLTSCTVCGKNYGSKWKTYDHLNKSHGRVFRACKVCLEVFNNEQELQAHVDLHHSKGMKKYVPAENLPPFEQEQEQEREQQKDSPDIELDLEDSDGDVGDVDGDDEGVKDEYEGKSILEKHLVGAYRSNNNSQQLAQQQVKQNGVSMSAAPVTPKHSKQHSHSNSHPEELINSSKRTVYVNSNDPSVCDICHKNWPAKKHLWQHYIRCHKQVAATVCGICLSTNKSYLDLQRHLNAEHPTLLHGKGFGSNFICRICGRYHNASSKLKLHMAIHIKFDWSLLDNPQKLEQSGVQGQVKDEQHYDDDEEDGEGEEVPQQKFKFKVKIKPPQKNPVANPVVKNEDVNFESMIEQVEYSTNSSSSSESEGEAEDGGENDDDGEVEDVDEVEDGDEGEDGEDDEDDGEDDDEGEVEEEDEQNVSQVEEEEQIDDDEQEVEEMSDDDDDDEDDDEEEDDDDEEDEPETKTDVIVAQEQTQNNHVKYETLEEDNNDNEEGEPEEAEDEEYEEEYEEVVEEVVHQDDITIYEQEEIIEDSYMESDEEQIVVQADHQSDVEEMDDNDNDNDEDDDVMEDEEEEEEESTSSLSQEIIYEPSHQVTYIQDGGDDDDDVENEEEEEGTQVLDVDSAVQSICYEEDDSCHDGNVAEEYEVQSTNAPGMNNQHEIQSAVDSIL